MVPFVHVNSVFDCIAFVRFHFFVWLCCYSGVLLGVVGLCLVWSNLSVSAPIDRMCFCAGDGLFMEIAILYWFGFVGLGCLDSISVLASYNMFDHVLVSLFGNWSWSPKFTALCTRFFSNPFKKNETCIHIKYIMGVRRVAKKSCSFLHLILVELQFSARLTSTVAFCFITCNTISRHRKLCNPTIRQHYKLVKYRTESATMYTTIDWCGVYIYRLSERNQIPNWHRPNRHPICPRIENM